MRYRIVIESKPCYISGKPEERIWVERRSKWWPVWQRIKDYPGPFVSVDRRFTHIEQARLEIKRERWDAMPWSVRYEDSKP